MPCDSWLTLKKELLLLAVLFTFFSASFGWYLVVVAPRRAMANALLDKHLQLFISQDGSTTQMAFLTLQPEKLQVGPWACEWAANHYQKTGVWRY